MIVEIPEEELQVVKESIKQYHTEIAAEENALKYTKQTYQELSEWLKLFLEKTETNYTVKEDEAGITWFDIEGCILAIKIDESHGSALAYPHDFQRLLNGERICGSIVVYRKDHRLEKFVLVKRLLVNSEGMISSQYEHTRFEERDKLMLIAQAVLRDGLTGKVKVCHPKSSEIDIVDQL